PGAAVGALGVRNQRPPDLTRVLRVRIPVTAKNQLLAVSAVLRPGLQKRVERVAVQFLDVGTSADAASDRVTLAVLSGAAELRLIGVKQELALKALCQRAEAALP